MESVAEVTLLDADVLIDVQLSVPPALEWLSQVDLEVAVPMPVTWELLYGSRHKLELQRSIRFLKSFDVEHFTEEDGRKTQELILRLRLSSGLSISDFMIAAMAVTRGATLFTFNLKHFSAVPGLLCCAPYER